ncbi:hypothetical protein A1O1_04188 [Capronia coronata CBS 617.96]|uniref:AB hydrolase-1 domain-containing protein n=1 Tax=Capronia coronata CBS 617.96 TaxID=1182541 RepID=W9YPB3_9EURO|nr:uncharacterized protein A1O1_04188 [Capronia coronata CBS 617.96]EXJ91081.1 hypothetical protein A1O1_04188 [Capronia coronata CBS 617.96]
MPFAKINNHSLHYTDIAPTGDQEPKLTLILVHGLGSTQNYYFPIFPYLANYRCIVFDNYGAGRSVYDGGETSIPSIAQDVLGLLDHLGVPKAVVVGYSMGAIVPTYLASTSPDRVVAGVCIGPVNPNENAASVFEQRITIVKEGGIETMANTIPNAATGSKATATAKGFIREMIMGQSPEGYIANCRAIAAARQPEYEKVKCPILIIAGEQDKSAPLAGCKEIFAHLGTEEKNKRLEILPGVGHWYCVEVPDEVGPLVRDFCGQLL